MEEEVVPPVRSELAHRPVQVGLGRADRQAEQLGDRPIREATGRERGDLGFAAGQALGQEVPRFGSRDPAPVLLDEVGEARRADAGEPLVGGGEQVEVLVEPALSGRGERS